MATAITPSPQNLRAASQPFAIKQDNFESESETRRVKKALFRRPKMGYNLGRVRQESFHIFGNVGQLRSAIVREFMRLLQNRLTERAMP